MQPLTNNVFDCALAFEGGGYRGAYTAGLVNVLLENDIYFDYVCGISAGSSHTINYLSRDKQRVREAFLAIDGNEPAAGFGCLLRGKGYFNADYLYEGCLADNFATFDWDTFQANPAHMRIQAFERDTGRTITFTKGDMPNVWEAVKRVRASSTVPGVMPPEPINGVTYLDGELGDGAGIPLPMIERDGFKSFVFVATHEEGYRKKGVPPMVQLAIKRIFGKYPHLVEALLTRPARYNDALDKLAKLEQKGQALVVRPDAIPVKNTTIDTKRLEKAYELGHAQAQRELDRIVEFIGL